MDGLMAHVQKASLRDGVEKHGGLFVLRRHLLEGLPELRGERADAAVPLLLGVPPLFLDQPAVDVRANAP